MKTGFITLLAMLMMSAACERIPLDEGIRLDKSLATELKKAQETISIDGKDLLLTANLWRDFMPSIGKPDNSMRAAVKVTCSNKIPLPENLEIVRLMVVKGDSVWVAKIENSDISDQQIIEAGTKGGPEWKVDDKADVVVELNDGNHIYYLRKANVKNTMELITKCLKEGLV